jgi:iron complex outermembrane receptor protein
MSFRLNQGLLLALLLVPSGLPAQVAEEKLSLSLDSLLGLNIGAAARHEQTSRDAPASITVVTAEDILRFGYETLGELLSGVPGFYSTYDRKYLYTGVRGFSRPGEWNNRILLLLDGNPLNEPYFGSVPVGNDLAVPLETFERVEVVRGPGSALYGSNAMFAVVNLITKRGKDINGGRVLGQFGTLGEIRGSVAFGKEWSNGLDLFLLASGMRSEGESLHFPEFEEDGEDGFARNLDWDRSFGFRGVARQGALTVSVLASHREKGIPTAPWETLFNVESSSLDTWYSLEGSWERRVGSGRTLHLRGFLNHYGLEGSYPYDPDDGGVFAEEATARWAGAEVRHTWDISGGHRLIAGGEVRRMSRTKYVSRDNSGLVGSSGHPFSLYSGFLQDEIHLGRRFLVTFGLRADKSGSRSAEFSPRAALVAQPNDGSTLKFLYGTAFRAPNQYELYYEDPGFHRLPEGLEPERLTTLEAVLEQRLADGLYTSFSVFRTVLDGFIDEGYDEETEETFFENRASARSRGAELGFLFRGRDGLTARLGYGYAAAEDTDSGLELSNSPKHLFRAAVSAPAVKGFKPAVEVRYDHSRWTVQETRTGSFFLANLILSTDGWLNGVEGSLAVKNVFDEQYRLPGGWEHLQDGITQTGRTVHLGLGYRF